ncbi:hypothetical protein PR048_016999 [Dryococelus australis]|uniref:Uncharacterized protein n=1 Tax=Dryococelus australis TaxID=614101 RepID=A0ABQ9H8D0_9NEOP|nr:hypothetical protein PR048_016999 [Dryococelus australis]
MAGSSVPPLLVFPQEIMSPTLEKDGPPEVMYTCSNNGWSNEKKNKKSWTGFDTFKTIHVTLEAYDFLQTPWNCHGYNSIPFLPPLTTTGRNIFCTTDPMVHHHRGCDIFMKLNAQRIIRPDDIGALFNRVFSHVATIAKGVAGFEATGIMRLDANIFTSEDFAFEIETGNLTTVPQASSSQQVETNI